MNNFVRGFLVSVKAPDGKAPVVYLPEYGSFMIEGARPLGLVSSTGFTVGVSST